MISHDNKQMLAGYLADDTQLNAKYKTLNLLRSTHLDVNSKEAKSVSKLMVLSLSWGTSC